MQNGLPRYTVGGRVIVTKKSASTSFFMPSRISSSPIGARQSVGGAIILTPWIAL